MLFAISGSMPLSRQRRLIPSFGSSAIRARMRAASSGGGTRSPARRIASALSSSSCGVGGTAAIGAAGEAGADPAVEATEAVDDAVEEAAEAVNDAGGEAVESLATVPGAAVEAAWLPVET